VSGADTIRVVGHGASSVEPDVVVVALGVEVTAAAPAAALQAGSTAFGQLRAALLDGGVEPHRLQTSHISLQPEWDHRGGRRPVGYLARADVTAVLPDPGRLGDLLAAAVERGGDAARVYNIAWQVSDPDQAAAAARTDAFADAHRRAEHYASLAGRALGTAVKITEGNDLGDGFRHRRFAGAALMASAGMDVDAGEVAITTAVAVTWELT
jgi:uncharacterized protein YggE